MQKKMIKNSVYTQIQWLNYMYAYISVISEQAFDYDLKFVCYQIVKNKAKTFLELKLLDSNPFSI